MKPKNNTQKPDRAKFDEAWDLANAQRTQPDHSRWHSVTPAKKETAEELYKKLHALLQEAGLQIFERGQFARPVEQTLTRLVELVVPRLKR